jgi:hypothetical protein
VPYGAELLLTGVLPEYGDTPLFAVLPLNVE